MVGEGKKNQKVGTKPLDTISDI